jgi:hypothetical protein
MIPALALAATLALAPAHRVAGFRAGATTADERVLAIDATRAITYRAQDHTIRAVPFDDVAKATTLAAGVNATHRFPVAAPPLFAWNGHDQVARIAPIDAPERAVAVRGDEVQSMKCNATSCLATMTLELQLLHFDATPYAHLPQGGARVLASDPDGFLVFRAPTTLMRVENGGAITFSLTTTSALAFAAADFDRNRYDVVWPEYDFPTRTTVLRAMSVGLGGNTTPLPNLISLPAAINDSIAIAYNAGQHLLVFADADPDFALVLPGAVAPSHLAALRLDAALRPLDAAPIVVDATPWAVLQPAVIASGSGFLTAWSHSPDLFFTSDPEAATVDADGRVSPRMILSRGLVPQTVSSAATVPGAMLVGYLEWPHEDGVPTLRVARVALDATPLGDVVVAAADAHQSAMAARGSDVLVAWTDAQFAAKAAILHGDNTLQPVPLPPLSGSVSAAANRDGWMLAVASVNSVDYVRIDANGVAAAPQSLVAIPSTNFDAAVASDGDRFLIVWGSDGGSGNATCNFVPCGTRAALLDATGGVLNDRITLSASRDVGGVTFAGGEYFVATTTAIRLEPDGMRIGANPPVRYSRVAPFGNAVLAVLEAIDATHVFVIDHGTTVAEATLPATPVEITTAGVAYDVDVDGLSAVVFQMFVPGRRRAAGH